MEKICYIVNPNGIEAPVISSLREIAGPECVFTTENIEHAANLAHEAARSGFQKIVAGGGDGMIHSVINGLAPKFDVDLGQLQFGSANDFGRSFNYTTWSEIDLKLYHALLQLGRVVLVDLIKIEFPGRTLYGATQATFGFSGEVVNIVSQMKERSPGMYLKVGRSRAWKARPFKIAGGYQGEVLDVYATNTSTIAGGMLLAPKASLFDGKLELLVIRKTAVLFRYLLLGLAQCGLVRSRLATILGATIGTVEDKVEFEVFEPLHAQVDGEHYNLPVGKVKISVLPRTLRVIIPK